MNAVTLRKLDIKELTEDQFAEAQVTTQRWETVLCDSEFIQAGEYLPGLVKRCERLQRELIEVTARADRLREVIARLTNTL